MASSITISSSTTFLVRQPLSLLSSMFSFLKHGGISIPNSTSQKPHRIPMVVYCGQRHQNRGPLLRGRILSTEAMLAIQALKRAQGDDSKLDQILRKTLIRLIKPDLLASLKELQRQDQWHLALKVFWTVRRESWYRTDYSLYSEMITTLARNEKTEEIDCLVLGLLEEKFTDDIRGLTRLLKTLIAAGRVKNVVEIYGLMKGGGCVPDEFMFRVLIRGLRRLGEPEIANMVEKDFELFSDGKLECLSMGGNVDIYNAVHGS